jgi:hypothetical protein
MKLLTKAVERQLRRAWEKPDGIARAHFFNPSGAGDWFIEGYNPNKELFYGLCCIQTAEYGYVHKSELEEFKGRFGLRIERDKFWTPKSLEECEVEAEKRGYGV